MQSAPAPAPPPPPPPSEFVSRLAQIVPRIAAIAPHLKLFAPAKYDEYITYLHNNHPRNSSANQARKRTHSGSVAAESAKKLDTKETAAVETTVPAKLELPAKKDAALKMPDPLENVVQLELSDEENSLLGNPPKKARMDNTKTSRSSSGASSPSSPMQSVSASVAELNTTPENAKSPGPKSHRKSPPSSALHHSSSSSTGKSTPNRTGSVQVQIIEKKRDDSNDSPPRSKRMTREELDQRDRERKEKERERKEKGSGSIRKENGDRERTISGGFKDKDVKKEDRGRDRDYRRNSSREEIRDDKKEEDRKDVDRNSRDDDRRRDSGREEDRKRKRDEDKKKDDDRRRDDERRREDDKKRGRDDEEKKRGRDDDDKEKSRGRDRTRSRSRSRDRAVGGGKQEGRYESPDRRPRVRSRDRRDKNRSRSPRNDKRDRRDRDRSRSDSRDRRKRDGRKDRSKSRDRSRDRRRDDDRKDDKRKPYTRDDGGDGKFSKRAGSPAPLPPPSSKPSIESRADSNKSMDSVSTPLTPQATKKVSLSEYTSKKVLPEASPYTSKANGVDGSSSSSAAPVPSSTRVSVPGESSKHSWKNLVAMHKHTGDQVNQRSKESSQVSDADLCLLNLHYSASVFYSLLETGKDDVQICNAHTMSSSLLQFVLKRMTKSATLAPVLSLMLRLECVLLNRSARKRAHDAAKRAKGFTNYLAEKQKEDSSMTKLELDLDSSNMALLKDALNISIEADGLIRKAESNWITAEKLCQNYHAAFPGASGEDGAFSITPYCEYRELALYGIRCLRDFAATNGLEEFFKVGE